MQLVSIGDRKLLNTYLAKTWQNCQFQIYKATILDYPPIKVELSIDLGKLAQTIAYEINYYKTFSDNNLKCAFIISKVLSDDDSKTTMKLYQCTYIAVHMIV